MQWYAVPTMRDSTIRTWRRRSRAVMSAALVRPIWVRLGPRLTADRSPVSPRWRTQTSWVRWSQKYQNQKCTNQRRRFHSQCSRCVPGRNMSKVRLDRARLDDRQTQFENHRKIGRIPWVEVSTSSNQGRHRKPLNPVSRNAGRQSVPATRLERFR